MIDLRKPYQWEEFNDRLKDQLQTTHQVRFFQSVQQALLETVMGFQNLYSHKRQFASHIGLGTHADEALLFLSRQGIKNLEISNELSNDEKKTMFHVLDLDDAITAEVYKAQYKFDEKLFRISVSHHLHFYAQTPFVLPDTEVAIWSLPEGAIAFHGKRCVSVPTVFGATLNSQLYNKSLSNLPIEKKRENKSWVQSIEAQSISASASLPGLSPDRVYDRAILSWNDVEGEALRQTLIADHSISEKHLESLSLSRWNELKLISQFEKRSWTPEMFRGTLLVSSDLSEDKTFIKKIESAVKKLRSFSTF